MLVRNVAKHEWCRNLWTVDSEAAPRHREIKDHLAKHNLALLDCH